MSKALHLVVTGEWYDKILSGQKKEEYRELKPFWEKRLFGKSYNQVLFQHGYSRNARRMLVELKGIKVARPKLEYSNQSWFDAGECFVLQLGEVVG